MRSRDLRLWLWELCAELSDCRANESKLLAGADCLIESGMETRCVFKQEGTPVWSVASLSCDTHHSQDNPFSPIYCLE